MLNLTKFSSEPQGFSDLLNYAFLVDDGIMLQKDGSFCACFKYQAADIFSATPQERNYIASRVNNFLTKFGTGWGIQFDSIRSSSNSYDEFKNSYFTDPITKFIDEERSLFFNNNNTLYNSETYGTLTYYPPSAAKAKIASMVFDDDATNNRGLSKILVDFSNKVEEFLSFASSSFINIEHLKSEEMLSFLNLSIVGKNNKIIHPQVKMYLDVVLARNFTVGVVPKIDNKYIQIVAIEGYPMTSYPNILDSLAHLELDYRWNNKFVPLDNYEALQRLEKIRKKWRQKQKSFAAQMFNPHTTNIDEDAQSKEIETKQAITEVNSGVLIYGYHSTNIVIFSEDRQLVEEQAAAVRRIIESQGFVARIEDINIIEAYLGSLPGNITPNIRNSLIGSMSLSHLLPLSTLWQGNKYNENDKFPPKSPPLMKVVSGSTPFYFNLHVGDIGHTLIFGPTGAGKSTLLATIVAQARRYQHSRIFAFDKGMSLYPLIKAVKGDHYNIASDDSNLSFAPFSNLKTESDISWAETYLLSLVELQGHKPSPDQKALINTAIKEHIKNKGTSLTVLVSYIQDIEIRAALKHYTLEGSMGRLLDAESDALSLSHFSVFEVEELMNLADEDAIPVLLYLFRMIEKSLDGNPSFLILDEAWILLGHPVFRAKIREWLKVLRKANCAVIIATQSLSDAAQSGILDVLQESCPTKILLPNTEAWNKGTDNAWGPYDFYKLFGLNDREIKIITEATPKREYYYKSPHGTRLFNLALGQFVLAFVGASGKADIAKIKTLEEDYGDEWPNHWLRIRGFGNE